MAKLGDLKPNLNSPEVVNRLVEDNIKLAQFFAARAVGIDPDEALSLALRGLQRAAELWDETRGKFGTYASIQIKSAIGRYRQYMAREIRGGKALTVSLNDLVGEEQSTELGDLIADESASTTKSLLISDDAKLFEKALLKLTDRERYIIRCRFGIGDEEQTLEEVGAVFGISRERVRQIEVTSLEKMRSFIERAPRVQRIEDKVLKKLRAAAWYRKNKARISKKAKERYRLFSQIIKARVREWYWKNHRRALQSALGYRETHREILAAKQLQRYHRRYKDDPVYIAKAAARRERNRPRQRSYAKARSLAMTDGYIKELLHKQTGRPTFTFTADEISAKRQKVIDRRQNPPCPFCRTQGAKNGTVRGVQRFVCWRGCQKTFFVQSELEAAA